MLRKSCVRDYLIRLSETRPAFHSEADFQLSFGNLLSSSHEVRLEKPFFNIPLNHNPELIIPKMEMDIFFPKELIGIELKYKTIDRDFLNDGEDYKLKNHGAQNLGRFDFFEDVRRLQSLKNCGKIKSGFVIFLTNDPLYWRKMIRRNLSSQFDMSERIIPLKSQLTWLGNPSVGSVTSKRLGNHLPILIENEITLKWMKYSTLSNMDFKFVLVEV
jgi:hypothetical protein